MAGKLNNNAKAKTRLPVILLVLLLIPLSAGQVRGEPPPFRNTIGMTFVWIPPGDFMMGSAGQEAGRRGDEPRHQVTITSPFFIQIREVTQGQWERIMGRNPSHFRFCGRECPVEQVSWHDAQEFIRRLNEKEGINLYRLPTEAEWEYAARGASSIDPGAGFLYLAAGDACRLEEAAWFNGNSCRVMVVGGDNWTDAGSVNECGPQPGGRKKPNSWGLYDMLGNVWEWVQDWRGSYPTGPVVNPVGPPMGDIRVYRGGSWLSSPGYCLPAVRGGATPGSRDLAVGFRLVRTVAEEIP